MFFVLFIFSITFEATSILRGLIDTRDLAQTMKTAERIEAGYVWINGNGRYMGAPYVDWKRSGLGAEETIDEPLSDTQIKIVHMRW